MTTQSEGLSPQEARLQRILKIIVLVLGIAILAVLGIIVSKIVGGFSKDDPLVDAPTLAITESEGEAVAGSEAGAAKVINQDLHLPKGAAIVDMTLGDGMLAVRYRLASGVEEIALLDMADGVLRGRVRVVTSE